MDLIKAEEGYQKSGSSPAVASSNNLDPSPDIREIVFKYDVNPTDGALDWTEYKLVVQENLKGTRYIDCQWNLIRRLFNRYAGSKKTLNARDIQNMLK